MWCFRGYRRFKLRGREILELGFGALKNAAFLRGGSCPVEALHKKGDILFSDTRAFNQEGPMLSIQRYMRSGSHVCVFLCALTEGQGPRSTER